MSFFIKIKKRLFTKKWICLIIIALLIIIISVIAINSYLTLRAARSNLLSAKSLIENIDQNISSLSSKSNRETSLLKLKHAQLLSAEAKSSLNSSYGLNTLKVVPYLGTQVDGIDALSSDVNKTIGIVYLLLNQVNNLDVSTGLAGHQIPTNKLQILSSDLTAAYSHLKTIEVPTRGLIGSLDVQSRHFSKIMIQARSDLTNAMSTLNVLIRMCGVNSTKVYLVVGDNNAEMRDQGAPLSYSILTISKGKFSLSQPNRIIALNLKKPVQFNLAPGTQAVFGELQPTMLWQSTDATANFDTTGELMAAMYKQATGSHVDGVIALDVPLLAELLTLTGPVSIPTIATPVDSQNIGSIILNQLYNSVPNNDQTFRRDEVAAVADAILNKLSSGSKVNIFKLGEDLIHEADGRHILVWLDNSKQESVLNFDGVGGDPSYIDSSRTFHVAVENATATKMDYYMAESVKYEVTIVAGNKAIVNTQVIMTDNAPLNARPSYQLGPDNINSFVPGEYVGRAEFWGPSGSEQLSSVSESGLRLNEVPFKVFPGKSVVLDMQTIIPDAIKNNQFGIRLVPQSRLYPVNLSVTLNAPGYRIVSSPNTENISWDKTENFTWKLNSKP